MREQPARSQRSQLTSRSLGRYFCHCCINDFSFTSSELQLLLERFAEADAESGRLKMGTRRMANLEEVLPLLTWEHERQHYLTLISTSTGMLLWRLYSDILSTGAFLLRKINMSGAREGVSYPLQQWYAEGGKDRLTSDPPFDPVVASSLGISRENYRGASAALVDVKFTELDLLTRFLDAFLGTAIMPMSEFVDLGNRACQVMAERSEVLMHREFQWSSRHTDRQYQVPDVGFTVVELLEADARLREHQLLSALGASSQVLAEWRKAFIFGDYKRVYDWLLSELGSVTLARAALGIALCGPVDPGAGSSLNGPAFVEDVHPCWRLTRVVKALQDNVWPWQDDKRNALLQRGIAEDAGIPTPDAVLESLLANPTRTTRARYADANLRGVAAEHTTTPYHEFIEGAVMYALRQRQRNPLSFVAATEPAGVKPLLEFFSDRVVLNAWVFRDGKRQQVAEAAELLPKAVTDLVAGLAVFALLEGGDVSGLLALERSYGTEVVIPGLQAITGRQMHVREIVANAVGPIAAERLRWSA